MALRVVKLVLKNVLLALYLLLVILKHNQLLFLKIGDLCLETRHLSVLLLDPL
jgi:hypothetical protein